MTQALEAPAGSKARTDARNALKKAVDAAG
jgi:hypothetical protein